MHQILIMIYYLLNFCNKSEYIKVFKKNNIKIIVDNINVIKDNIDIFANKSIGLRIDLGKGYGHHKKVITQGLDSKFGIIFEDIIENKRYIFK